MQKQKQIRENQQTFPIPLHAFLSSGIAAAFVISVAACTLCDISYVCKDIFVIFTLPHLLIISWSFYILDADFWGIFSPNRVSLLYGSWIQINSMIQQDLERMIQGIWMQFMPWISTWFLTLYKLVLAWRSCIGVLWNRHTLVDTLIKQSKLKVDAD